MKIAHVVCTYPPYKGGIGNVAKNFCDLLSDSGHLISVFTPLYDGNNENNNQTLSTIRLRPFLKYGNGAFLPQIFNLLNNFDIVHLHYPFFGTAEVIWLKKVIKKKSFKLIVHYHMDTDSLALIPKVLSFFSKLILNSLLNRSSAVTCASLDYIENSSIRKYFFNNKNKFFEISFGVDGEKFYPKQSVINDETKNRVNIIFVGALDKAHTFKGVDILLHSLSMIKNDKWNLTVVGGGDMKEIYERIAINLNINNQVNFLGKVSDKELVNIYRSSDFHVLPSTNKHEAFGTVLLEAMSSGLPVIASNLPGVRSVFNDGEQGYFVEPGNVNDLKNKIEILLNNQNLRKKMGYAARILTEKKYSWKKVRDNLLSVYESI